MHTSCAGTESAKAEKKDSYPSGTERPPGGLADGEPPHVGAEPPDGGAFSSSLTAPRRDDSGVGRPLATGGGGDLSPGELLHTVASRTRMMGGRARHRGEAAEGSAQAQARGSDEKVECPTSSRRGTSLSQGSARARAAAATGGLAAPSGTARRDPPKGDNPKDQDKEETGAEASSKKRVPWPEVDASTEEPYSFGSSSNEACKHSGKNSKKPPAKPESTPISAPATEIVDFGAIELSTRKALPAHPILNVPIQLNESRCVSERNGAFEVTVPEIVVPTQPRNPEGCQQHRPGITLFSPPVTTARSSISQGQADVPAEDITEESLVQTEEGVQNTNPSHNASPGAHAISGPNHSTGHHIDEENEHDLETCDPMPLISATLVPPGHGSDDTSENHADMLRVVATPVEEVNNDISWSAIWHSKKFRCSFITAALVAISASIGLGVGVGTVVPESSMQNGTYMSNGTNFTMNNTLFWEEYGGY